MEFEHSVFGSHWRW